ncbi:MAG: beta-N-acetylhexosaminidase [Alphaproteobacteria bacterium]|nr:beta-N-acetylhexosaminidase [Alphaproteobacteria bacterium]
MLPLITACSGPELTAEEKAVYRSTNPLGLILFQRNQNVQNPRQVKKLVDQFRDAVGREDAPILIDQEGGPLQMMRTPEWANLPSATTLGTLYMRDKEKGERAIKLQAQAISGMLRDSGLTNACAPVLDVPVKGASGIIGSRAFCEDPIIIAEIATIISREFLACGITPTLKHFPGHGRAKADTHVDFAAVDTDIETLEKTDFFPFKKVHENINPAFCWTMTAHVAYTAFDDDPFTISSKAIQEIRPMLNAWGPMISDAIDMESLKKLGRIPQRAKGAIDAGCDAALYCDGKLYVMQEIADLLPPMTEETKQRFAIAEQERQKGSQDYDWREAAAELATYAESQDEPETFEQKRVFSMKAFTL